MCYVIVNTLTDADNSNRCACTHCIRMSKNIILSKINIAHINDNDYYLRYFNLLGINMKKFNIVTFSLTFYLLVTAGFLQAKEHEVKLLTTGSNGTMMVFEPNFLKIAPGDVVNFIPSDSSHNAESFSVPSEKSTFTTPYGKATKVTFNEEGVILVKWFTTFRIRYDRSDSSWR